MIVCLSVGDPAGDYAIGEIEVTLNDNDRMKQWLDLEWALWREEVEHPDSDSQFIDWLEKRYPSSVQRINIVLHHTFQ